MPKKSTKKLSVFGKHWPMLQAGWASYHLWLFEKYVQTVGKALQDEARRLPQRVKKELAKLEGEEKFEREQFYQIHADDLKSEFPSILYETLYIGIHARFEQELVTFCDKIQDIRGYKISVEDFGRNDIIGNCHKYYTKVADIPFPNSGTEWNVIKKLRTIRNKIVHERGRLVRKGAEESEEAKELQKFVVDKKGTVSKSKYVHVTEEFCLFTISVLKAFLTKIGEVTPPE